MIYDDVVKVDYASQLAIASRVTYKIIKSSDANSGMRIN